MQTFWGSKLGRIHGLWSVPAASAGGREPGSPTCQALTLPSPALQALPPLGIRIFASQLHTHLTGTKVVTMLVRDGQEIEIVNRDDHYSPNFQVGAACTQLQGCGPGSTPVLGSPPGPGPDTHLRAQSCQPFPPRGLNPRGGDSGDRFQYVAD